MAPIIYRDYCVTITRGECSVNECSSSYNLPKVFLSLAEFVKCSFAELRRSNRLLYSTIRLLAIVDDNFIFQRSDQNLLDAKINS